MARSNAVYLDLNTSDLMYTDIEELGDEEQGTDHFETLSNTIVSRILAYLPARSLMEASNVSRRWRRLCRNPALWTRPRLHFLSHPTFYLDDARCRELFRLLHYAPSIAFDRLELSLGVWVPQALLDALLADPRPIRSLLVAYSAPLCPTVVALLKKHRSNLEELQMMGWFPNDAGSAAGGSAAATKKDGMREVWLAIAQLDALRSLSLDRAHLETDEYECVTGLEELDVGCWTGLAPYLVLSNRQSLKKVRVGGSYYDRCELLWFLVFCENLRELTVPCVKDVDLFRRCTKLTRLCIVEGPTTDAYFSYYLQESTFSRQLSSLRLRRVDGYIFKAISSETMPNLRSLSINYCKISAVSFGDVLKGLTLLEDISFAYSYFNTEEVHLLRQLNRSGILPRLRVLHLIGSCGYGPDGLFRTCLKKECSNILTHHPDLLIFLSEQCSCEKMKRKRINDASLFIKMMDNSLSESDKCLKEFQSDLKYYAKDRWESLWDLWEST